MVRLELRSLCFVLFAPGCFLPRDVAPIGVGSDGGRTGMDARVSPVDANVRIDAPRRIDSPTCTPSAEVCDGIDNDCNDLVDESDPRLNMPCDVGGDGCFEGISSACQAGVLVCTPNPETCNAVDDDCNSEVDNEEVCPCDLRRNGDHVYLFCRKSIVGFDAARAMCPSGYDLVQITDAPEQQFIRDRTREFAREADWWIGARGSDSDFEWVVDGSAVPDPGPSAGFQAWAPEQPSGDQDCVELDPDGTDPPGADGTWNDTGCETENRFICESILP